MAKVQIKTTGKFRIPWHIKLHSYFTLAWVYVLRVWIEHKWKRRTKRIACLRLQIQEPEYYYDRWRDMWRESDLWYKDYEISKMHSMLRNSIRFRKKAEWYSKRITEK